MNISKRTRDRLLLGAVMLGPVAGVLSIRAAAGLEPRNSAAASTAAAAVQAAGVPASLVLRADQKAALAYVKARPMPKVDRSPMHAPAAPPRTDQEAPEAARAAPPAADVSPDAPAMTLSTIFTSSNAALAIINGKVHRVGDRVSGDWTVRSIDGPGMTVVVAGPDGREVRLTTPRGG